MDTEQTMPTPTLEELFGGEEPECNCCQSFGVPLTVYPVAPLSPTYQNNRHYNLPQFRALCEVVCGNTRRILGRISQPARRRFRIGQVICYVGNEIIKAITKLSAIRWVIGVALSSWWNVRVVLRYQWLCCRLLRLHTFEEVLSGNANDSVLRCAFCPATKTICEENLS